MRRRDFIAGIGSVSVGGLAGCSAGEAGGDEQSSAETGTTPNAEFEPTSTGSADAPSITDLPDLEGELEVYLGRGEGGLYRELLEHLETELYPDLSLSVRRDSSASLANTIVEEEKHGSSPADVFWSIDAGALGTVARRGLTAGLPTDLTDLVPGQFRDDERRWTGISGRARAIPYNTDQYDESDVPRDVLAFPDLDRFDGQMGWAPTYGAFQAFVTSMRVVHGEGATEAWLEGMLESGVSQYAGEFLVTNAVAEGELGAGFANHYYALRLKEAKPDAPLELAFTSGDAGAMLNVSGAAVLESSSNAKLGTDFIRHFLSEEVQRFLAEKAFEYPLVPGIDAPGTLPPIEELEPPDFDLTRLAEVRPTLELLREKGVL